MKDAIAATISASEVVLDEVVAKRKRYQSVSGLVRNDPSAALNDWQDDPMRVWRPLAQLFLNELARRDGLSNATHCSVCEQEQRGRFFRCKQCGEGVFCEGYANMDWILLCTLWMERLLKYGFAYDIACQWMVHFFERLEVIKARACQFGLPVWHAGAHELKCRAQLALAYLLGFGKTDGEAMERVWALLNPAAWATKEMGEGARHDVLEDKIDHLNWEKNIGLGTRIH
ncbi:CxC2 domain-containing protein [Mycena chlorophos]|uniref:CxC2 domain-containing protein n=1 Tax=Mycena chlorophos TaxID=658473 RepID=A0A8H6TFZ0_MYCCL|nr:CxC2 domain-containing protein [Mycena chlorophos]